jgi:hypothetical protein
MLEPMVTVFGWLLDLAIFLVVNAGINGVMKRLSTWEDHAP